MSHKPNRFILPRHHLRLDPSNLRHHCHHLTHSRLINILDLGTKDLEHPTYQAPERSASPSKNTCRDMPTTDLGSVTDVSKSDTSLQIVSTNQLAQDVPTHQWNKVTQLETTMNDCRGPTFTNRMVPFPETSTNDSLTTSRTTKTTEYDGSQWRGNKVKM